MSELEEAGHEVMESKVCEDVCNPEDGTDLYSLDIRYECSNCGEFLRSETNNENHQCPQCNKFGQKMGHACLDCGEEAEWHIVAVVDEENHIIGDWDEYSRTWSLNDIDDLATGSDEEDEEDGDDEESDEEESDHFLAKCNVCEAEKTYRNRTTGRYMCP